MAGTSAAAVGSFSAFYEEVKTIEKRDSDLTPKQQIDRLLRPGATYFNLNPYEVLRVDPDVTVEDAKRAYKKLSVLIHPDKNLDNRERADQAFGILKKAVATIEDPDERDKIKDVIFEAKARLQITMDEKRRRLKREGKPVVIDEDEPENYCHAIWAMTNKVFADRDRKRKILEQRANEEKRRRMEFEVEESEKRKLEEEWTKNYEESRDERVGSWKKFQTKKAKKGKLQRGTFRPPQPKLDKS